MPRQPRYFIPGMPQHVLTRGIDRQVVFFQDSDYRLYLDALHDSATRHGCDIHAYVLMTNHVHLLITPHSERSLPLFMQMMGRLYVQKINRRYQRSGTLWEGRYKASLVQDDRYLLACQRYIELNPVRAGMVGGPGEYPWSSYACNAIGKPDGLITAHSVYRRLHRNPTQRLAAYRELFKDTLSETVLKEVRTTTNACLILGNSCFQDQIATMLGRDVRHRKQGRPKKTAT